MERLFLILALASCQTIPNVKVQNNEEIKAKIISIAQTSKCASYRWNNRGVATIGYIKGMALLYAKNHCKPLSTINTGKYGALNWYGLDRTQRNLFTLMIGLGLRESSGKYCCGRDRSNPKTGTSEGAEAGTFQTSYNAAYSVQVNGNPAAADEMRFLLKKYSTDQSQCLLDVFKEGVDQKYCTGLNAENFGSGVGLEYQKLSKSCPAFHAEFTALTLQNSYKHFGPIQRKEAEFKEECKDMLIQIEQVLESMGCPNG